MTQNNELIKNVTLLLGEHTGVVQYQLFRSDFSMESSKYDGDEEISFRTDLENAGITAEHVDNFGGEGQGEDYWSVYKFTKDAESVHVKFQGWYQSYSGSEFTEYSFVEPKEKLVTVYE